MKRWFCLCLLFFTAGSRADVVGHHEGAHDLLLSGDGKIAFSSGENGTRVWDVAGKRELAPLPVQAGQIIAASQDGRRVLCRRGQRQAERELWDLALWWRPATAWKKGTTVRTAAAEPLLDATFAGSEVVLLWEQGIERQDASRQLRRKIPLKELQGHKTQGALSPDGTRAVATGYVAEQSVALIYDAATGRALKQINLAQFNSYSGWEFSPNNRAIGAVVGEAVRPWNPNNGPQPWQFTRTLWDAQTGDELSSSYDFSLNFWPHGRQVSLVERPDNAPWKLELFDVFTEKTRPLPFSQPWKKQALKTWGFSHDGKTLVALDLKGALWVERVRSSPYKT
jgi:hypothetical protein